MNAPDQLHSLGDGAGAARHSTPQTVVLASLHPKRLRLELYLLARAAHRAVADCERMLERLREPARAAWREALGAALLSACQLRSVVDGAERQLQGRESSGALTTLEAQIREPQQCIVDAMGRLLRHVPVSPEDELLLQDALSLRDAAADLLSLRRPSPALGTPVIRQGQHAAPRILIADDERFIRDVLQRHLAKRGYEVLQVDNGHDALDAARRERLDLILSDIGMPGMDGITLLRELKSDEGTHEIPVIVISGQDDARSVSTCISLGADDHIAKPYDFDVLDARVRTSLEKKRLRDAEREYLQRVKALTAAARDVENDCYVPGSLRALSAQADELGQLARIFDRAVSRIKSREDRLQRRLGQLRHEMTQASGRIVPPKESEAPALAIGAILAQRYEIRTELGRGGMGTVFHARDLSLGEDIAIKVVQNALVNDDPTIVSRLKSEIRLARKISHPNVMRAHDLGECDGMYFITMELVNGITVEQIIDRRGRLSIEGALAVSAQLAEALAVAHEQQVVHRDVKPGNLMVDEKGVLKVMDFGIARSLLQPDRLTRGGFIVGTPQYMAPEQLMGKGADFRSDLFAAGVVMYECLTGKLPFTGESPVEMLQQMRESAFVPLGDALSDVSEPLEALVYQLLRPAPAARPASARELANRLGEIDVGVHRRASLAEHVHIELVDLEVPE